MQTYRKLYMTSHCTFKSETQLELSGNISYNISSQKSSDNGELGNVYNVLWAINLHLVSLLVEDIRIYYIANVWTIPI